MKIIKGSQHQYVIQNFIGECEKVKIYDGQIIITKEDVSVAIIDHPTWQQVRHFVTLRVMKLPRTINIIDICHTHELIVIMQKAQFFTLSESIILGISEVLKTLHANSMVHGNLKVHDFALCEEQLVLWQLGEASDAPELKYNEPYSTAVDIWALGCIWYEVCTGKSFKDNLDTLNQSGLPQNQLECIKAMLNNDFLQRPTIDEVIRVLMGKGFIMQLPQYNQSWINGLIKEYHVALKQLSLDKLQKQNIIEKSLSTNVEMKNQIEQKVRKQKELETQYAAEQIHLERQKASSIQFNKNLLDEQAAKKLQRSKIQIDSNTQSQIKQQLLLEDPSMQLLEQQYQQAVDQLRQEYGQRIQMSNKQIQIINTQSPIINDQANQIYNLIQYYVTVHEEKLALQLQIKQQEKTRLTDKQITYLGFSRIQINNQKVKEKIEQIILANGNIENEIENYLLKYYRENIRIVKL